jgi:hypothetical protein
MSDESSISNKFYFKIVWIGIPRSIYWIVHTCASVYLKDAFTGILKTK